MTNNPTNQEALNIVEFTQSVKLHILNNHHKEDDDQSYEITLKYVACKFLTIFGLSYTSKFPINILKISNPHLLESPGLYTMFIKLYNLEKKRIQSNNHQRLDRAISMYVTLYTSLSN